MPQQPFAQIPRWRKHGKTDCHKGRVWAQTTCVPCSRLGIERGPDTSRDRQVRNRGGTVQYVIMGVGYRHMILDQDFGPQEFLSFPRLSCRIATAATAKVDDESSSSPPSRPSRPALAVHLLSMMQLPSRYSFQHPFRPVAICATFNATKLHVHILDTCWQDKASRDEGLECFTGGRRQAFPVASRLWLWQVIKPKSSRAYVRSAVSHVAGSSNANFC